MAMLKALKHKYVWGHKYSLGTSHNVAQFTDPIPLIYWYAKRATLTLNMPVYNQIKAMYVFLAVSEM